MTIPEDDAAVVKKKKRAKWITGTRDLTADDYAEMLRADKRKKEEAEEQKKKKKRRGNLGRKRKRSCRVNIINKGAVVEGVTGEVAGVFLIGLVKVLARSCKKKCQIWQDHTRNII